MNFVAVYCYDFRSARDWIQDTSHDEEGQPMTARTTRTPVRGSRSGRPVMVLLDLLGRRWALRILWELRDGPLTFRALQAACGNLSPSVLNDRLRELREAGILELREPEGYGPTAIAEELGEILIPLDSWAKRWARRTR
jgi:DNA-binding HxlR family transcriptional regulator